MLGDVCSGGNTACLGNANVFMEGMLAEQQFFHRPYIFLELIQCLFAPSVILSFCDFFCFIVGMMITDFIDEVDIAGAEQVACGTCGNSTATLIIVSMPQNV